MARRSPPFSTRLTSPSVESERLRPDHLLSPSFFRTLAKRRTERRLVGGRFGPGVAVVAGAQFVGKFAEGVAIGRERARAFGRDPIGTRYAAVRASRKSSAHPR